MPAMTGFEPLESAFCHTLILGSMPGRRSLQAGRYYAHPRNAFWRIMDDLYGVEQNADYPERVAQLVSAGIAVWDVLFDCDRAGSLDTNIVRQTEQANDFDGFFQSHANIRRVAFNGAAAQQIFMRHYPHLVSQQQARKFMQLPSTSPAHAAMSVEQKVAVWRAFLLDEAG